MKAKFILLQLISLLVCFELAAASHSPQLLHYQHMDLHKGQIQALDSLKGKPTLMMFFEPQCPWCLKQGKAFNSLLGQCPDDFNIVALGIHGDKASLKKAWWKMKLNFPGYLTGAAMLKDIGNVPATPITLIADEEGNLVSHLRGYVKLNALLPQLQQHFDLSCLNQA
ncbi:TlpA family protein disulfide reductase [Shewanella youngdeokensis]|uniref:Redoxin domain-containing protein n=1 Tax=Shewanella youngdeokensis TaxID=2999068 RepID=A0ABZ0JV45_9GAMM|nr:redoxin domain-containing protein [Shewanella sp. DAU334]